MQYFRFHFYQPYLENNQRFWADIFDCCIEKRTFYFQENVSMYAYCFITFTDIVLALNRSSIL